MDLWNKLRLPCLAMVLGAGLVTLGWGINTPLQPRPTIAAFTLPNKVPLPEWQHQKSYSIPLPTDKKLTPIASNAYQYSKEGLTLEIEMRYLTATKGDTSQFLRWYTNIPESVTIKEYQQPGIGSYIFLTHQNRAYLSSCIHPQGNTTTTGQQYLQTKLLYSINHQRIWGWLIGQDTLFNQQCLWSHLSIPIQPSSNPETAHEVLKKAWVNWSNWWQNYLTQL